MKYFLMEEDKSITQRPYIVNWHQKIDVRNISAENAHLLPKRELLFIRSSSDTIFTDIISAPFFLVSEKVKNVILMYEPRTILKEIVLLDQEYEKAERYYLPVFEAVDCLAKASILNLDHSESRKIVLEKEKITDRSIFCLSEIKSQKVVGNLEIVESILKREITGIHLKELEIHM